MRDVTRSSGDRGPERNRRVGELSEEIRASACPTLPRDARRRAERRVRLIAGLLDPGTPPSVLL